MQSSIASSIIVIFCLAYSLNSLKVCLQSSIISGPGSRFICSISILQLLFTGSLALAAANASSSVTAPVVAGCFLRCMLTIWSGSCGFIHLFFFVLGDPVLLISLTVVSYYTSMHRAFYFSHFNVQLMCWLVWLKWLCTFSIVSGFLSFIR